MGLPGESERLQDRHFASTFADGHGHGISGNEQSREHYRETNTQDERLHIAHAVDKAELKRLLAFRFLWARESCGT